MQHCTKKWLPLLHHSIERRLLREAREELLVAHDAELCYHAFVAVLGSMLLTRKPTVPPSKTDSASTNLEISTGTFRGFILFCNMCAFRGFIMFELHKTR